MRTMTISSKLVNLVMKLIYNRDNVELPLAVESAKSGYRVIGFDVQKEKINMVNEGINYIGDINLMDLRRFILVQV